MSDTVKLIIEMPKELSERVCRASSVPDIQGTDIVNVINIVKNGILLDDIKAEIEEHVFVNQSLNVDRARALCWCLDVIDKHIGKTESHKLADDVCLLNQSLEDAIDCS